MNPESDRRRLLRLETAAEDQRLAALRLEADRGGGVGWSGLGADPPQRRSQEQIARAADLRLAALQRWRISRPGRVLAALARAERAVEALRSAIARGLAPDDRRCAQALGDLEVAAAEARRAMDAA